MKVVVIILGMLVFLVGLSSYWLSRPVVDGHLDGGALTALSVAPRTQALTLARSRSGAVLLVIEVSDEGVLAVDIGAASEQKFEDALDAYRLLGNQGLRAMVDAPNPVALSWRELGMPLVARFPHVAAGTNYSAHAQEVGHEGEPFLFPKLSRPTPWNAEVEAGTRLDYELELCAVTLSEHTQAAPAELGYLLCGDFTDRWLLVRDIDLDGEMGRTGFPLAKGGETRLPVGPLLVIPNSDAFYREFELSLYVNDVLRQKVGADKMLWSPRKILSHIFVDCRSPYQLGSEVIYLSSCTHVPAGTLIMTGTPGGVLFHLGTLWNPWVYLRPGDVVTSIGTYLGFMQNEITKR